MKTVISIMIIILSVVFVLLIYTLNNTIVPLSETIILQRNGELKKAEVRKLGVYCTASWYRTLDNFYLNPDGTAKDGPFSYRWTLHEFNSEQDKIWFNKNCKEVK